MSKHDNRDNNRAGQTAPEPEAVINDLPDLDDDVPGQEVPDAPQDSAASEDAADTLAKELERTQAALDKEKKEYLFLMAEFDNFRKRTLKEKSDIIRNAAESVLKGLLPIVDDFERGIEANASTTDPEVMRQGMELIYNKLVKYLEQNGVKAIQSTGEAFDPDLHEAIAMVPTPDEAQKGRVIDTPTKGYMLNDKVLRHAKVAVGQ